MLHGPGWTRSHDSLGMECLLRTENFHLPGPTRLAGSLILGYKAFKAAGKKQRGRVKAEETWGLTGQCRSVILVELFGAWVYCGCASGLDCSSDQLRHSISCRADFSKGVCKIWKRPIPTAEQVWMELLPTSTPQLP